MNKINRLNLESIWISQSLFAHISAINKKGSNYV